MEKAILVSIEKDDFSVNELYSLAQSANIDPVFTIRQMLDTQDSAYYIGSGKVMEVKESIQALDAELVIFDDELSLAQIRNLEKKLNVKVIDRSMLILSIFARRAKSKEAMIEVELAELKYMLPRLVGLNASLSRQGGGFSAKGPGEKKIELDRRRILKQIDALKKELLVIERSKKITRHKRKKEGIPVVALIGYTNAGKSATMNTLVKRSNYQDKQVVEKDMLFATLDTYVRRIKTNLNKDFLLVDTIGFVSKLPFHLVNSFKSTLDEALDADLLVHVVDASNPDYKKQIDITNGVIKELGADDIPMIYAFNKCDLVENFFPEYPNSLLISNKTMFNIDLLINRISDELFKSQRAFLLIPHDRGDLLNYLYENAKVIKKEFRDDGILVDVIITDSDIIKMKDFITK